MPYVGSVTELPAGQGTLTSDNNPSRARFLDLIVAEGIVSERGVWEREPGATPLASLLGGAGDVASSFAFTSRWSAAVWAFFKKTDSLSYLTNLGNENGLAVAKSITLADVVGADNTIAVTVTSIKKSDTAVIASVTDSQGNTYTRIDVVRMDIGGSQSVEVSLWVAPVVTPLGFGDTVTVTPTTTDAFSFTVSAIAGIDSATVTAADANVHGTTLAQPGDGSFSPDILPDPDANFLIIAYGDNGDGSGVTLTPDAITLRASKTLTTPSNGTKVTSKAYTAQYPFSLPAPNALADFWTSSSVQRVLALGSDGVVYKSSGGDFAPLTTATPMDDDASMIVIGGQESAGRNRKAFIFDGGNKKIQVVSGDASATTNFGNNWNTSTNIPADWASNPPRGAVVHKERLWAYAPTNAPHNIYASQIADHENFKNAVGGSLEYVQGVMVGTGERIVAAASFKGMLFVFKYPRGIAYLDDTDVDYLNWRWNPVTDALGAADSPYSVIVLDDDILFMGPDGHLNFLSAITQQGVTGQDLTAALNLQQWVRDNVNTLRLHRMASVWYPAKKLAMFALPSVASEKNDLRLMLDFSNASQEGQTVRISYSHRDPSNRCMAVRRDSATLTGPQKPIYGDDDGVVWKMDQESKSVVGRPGAGQARYQYNRTDLSHLDTSFKNRRKLFDALTITFKPVGAWNLAVDTVIDGMYHETLHFGMGGNAAILGTFQLGGTLTGGTVTTTRRRMTGHGYWLSIAGYVSGEGQDFSISSHLVNYRVGGEEQRK